MNTPRKPKKKSTIACLPVFKAEALTPSYMLAADAIVLAEIPGTGIHQQKDPHPPLLRLHIMCHKL